VPRPVKRRARRVINSARIAKTVVRPPPLPKGALDCVLARNEYGVYCVPRASRRRPAAQAVLQGQVWEKATVDLMRGTPGDVVHAGTFFGDFLPALASGRADAIWAFEPNSESYRCAKITVALNDLQVTLTPAALGKASGVGTLATTNSQGRPSGGGSRLISNASDGVRTETVALVTVDEVVPEDRVVGVLQLDVEGQEQQALLGALRTVQRCRPLLILEHLPERDWLEEHLPGYRLAGSLDGNAVLQRE
jgi:FkbM family methyltransferase